MLQAVLKMEEYVSMVFMQARAWNFHIQSQVRFVFYMLIYKVTALALDPLFAKKNSKAFAFGGRGT